MRPADNRAVLTAIFLFALFLRFWGFADPVLFIGDESQFVPSGQHFIDTGLYEPNGWLHPPLNFHVTVIGEKLFGNNPYGWRLLNVLFGGLSVMMLMLFSQRLFPDVRVGWLAGALFAIEPFHIQISRTNFVEIIPVFFFLLYLYAVVIFLTEDNLKALVLSGIPLGLSVAGKWYFVLPAVAVGATLVWHVLRQRGDRLMKLLLLFSTAVTAIGIYMLLFLPWFERGGDLPDFIVWQIDAYKVLQTLVISDFVDGFFRVSPSVPWHWFMKPLIVAQPLVTAGSWSNYFVIMSNYPIWLLVIPAFLYLLFRFFATHDIRLYLVLMLFLTSYVQFVIVKRPVFLYSSFAVLPFAYLMISRAISEIIGHSDRGQKIFAGIFIITIVWGIYLYPLVTSRMIPIFLYEYLLRIV